MEHPASHPSGSDAQARAPDPHRDALTMGFTLPLSSSVSRTSHPDPQLSPGKLWGCVGGSPALAHGLPSSLCHLHPIENTLAARKIKPEGLTWTQCAIAHVRGLEAAWPSGGVRWGSCGVSCGSPSVTIFFLGLQQLLDVSPDPGTSKEEKGHLSLCLIFSKALPQPQPPRRPPLMHHWPQEGNLWML